MLRRVAISTWKRISSSISRSGRGAAHRARAAESTRLIHVLATSFSRGPKPEIHAARHPFPLRALIWELLTPGRRELIEPRPPIVLGDLPGGPDEPLPDES